MRSTFFGVLSGPVVGLVLLLFAFLHINVLFWDDLGATPFYWWVLFVTLFLGCVVLFNRQFKIAQWNGIYLFVAAASFAYLNSMLQWSIDCCPEDYDSIIDWRNSNSLAWLLHFPFTVMVITAQGAVFDLLRSKGAHIMRVLVRAR